MHEKLIIGLLRFIAFLPLSAVHLLGAAVGRLMIWIPNRERRNARINIALCLPELTSRERTHLRDRSLVESLKTMLEMAGFWLRDVDSVLSYIKSVSGREVLNKAMERGKGVVVLIPHLGAWELCGLYLADIGPVTSLYRPPRMERLESVMTEGRERNGARLVPTSTRGVKRLFKALNAGELVAILPDQQPKSASGAVFAPFFNEPALTMSLVSRLVRKTGATPVFLFAERIPQSRGFHMRWIPAPEGIDDEDLVSSASALNRGVENCVRLCPEQYQWTYKRFRYRLPGVPQRYTGPL